MGAWQEIVDYTFTANETSRTFSGLSITKDDFVKVVMTVNSSSNPNTSIFPNTNTTTSNYHYQVLIGNGSSVVAERGNSAFHCQNASGETSYFVAYLKLSENDRFNVFSNYFHALSSNIRNNFIYTTSSGATFTSGLTALTFVSNQTNGIGTGSRIQIYKLAATKVADITVATNTTQVDISSLSIDKDSEYLLVSEVVGATATHFVNLTVNDSTTLSGYYSQRIFGDGSTASASRTNNARIQEGLSTDTSLAYVHIKLSNIGAYTAQSYSMEASGKSTIQVENWFVSSTAENITSITKLNIFTTNTNAIGAGSRFTLYKLYE